MILNIFEMYRDKNKYKKSVEYKFYKSNIAYLSSYPWLKKYSIVKDDFSLVCTNVIIQSLINKKILETTYNLAKLLADSKANDSNEFKKIISEELDKVKLGLPYVEKNNSKLYIPIFDLATNMFYEDEIYRIDNYPYSKLKEDFKDIIVNPFETYNLSVFNSSFTRLIHLNGDNTCDAFYHLVFETIYFINKQGGLDFIIPLYDRKMRYPIKEDSLKRVKLVTNAYFKSSRNELIDALYNNGLISTRLYRKLYKDISKRYKRGLKGRKV